ncbi:MAG: hypothetical protein ACLQGU_05555 [bacterium]
MKTKSLIIPILLFCGLCFCIKNALAETRLAPNDFALKSLELGQHVDDDKIISIFGKPGKIEELNPGKENYFRNYKYKGLTICTNYPGGQQTFYRFYINSGAIGISNGIRVGDPIKKVIEVYGEPNVSGETGNIYEYNLPINNSGTHSKYVIEFYNKDDKVSWIIGSIERSCGD